ncbi:hypothetical protein EGR_10591 [Echinococcus granulosus]|uniref:Uncharacterized protein n=1 Tax=Echinococcus granulosus TaxID=6210 RepID=W6UM28_ECHGR|nr:hypothetical protein EGR_10591 [Echinococcus granulosus]EUB54549.1 hypothetical protein EGR_10591 [Echinococcus granulosus]
MEKEIKYMNNIEKNKTAKNENGVFVHNRIIITTISVVVIGIGAAFALKKANLNEQGKIRLGPPVECTLVFFNSLFVAIVANIIMAASTQSVGSPPLSSDNFVYLFAFCCSVISDDVPFDEAKYIVDKAMEEGMLVILDSHQP